MLKELIIAIIIGSLILVFYKILTQESFNNKNIEFKPCSTCISKKNLKRDINFDPYKKMENERQNHLLEMEKDNLNSRFIK